MYCKVCGDERNVRYYSSKLNSLCRSCAKDTPRKVQRSVFDRAYWGEEFETVPDHIRREFYSDYLSSRDSVEAYKKATTSDC